MENYKNGINVGGWLSQYYNSDHEYFKTFIKENDIERIASWGLDHIRVPVDYRILESDKNPFCYKEDGFQYIDNCLEWTKKNNINLVLDLHSAQGFDFQNPNDVTLFTNSFQKERYVRLWEHITRRYLSESGNLAFDLLNEIVLPESKPWNDLYRDTVDEIRKVDPNRWLIVGGINYNSIFSLKDLEILNDDRVAYTFHFYEPHLFTHQKASWIELIKYYNQAITYPGEFTNLDLLIKDIEKGVIENSEQFQLRDYLGKKLDVGFIKKELEPAGEFLNRYNKLLYCGEFGVIERAAMSSRIGWTADLIDQLDQMKIGKAYWTYKTRDFGLVDYNGNIINEDLVEIICQKKIKK